jgi:hypothetical protein
MDTDLRQILDHKCIEFIDPHLITRQIRQDEKYIEQYIYGVNAVQFTHKSFSWNSFSKENLIFLFLIQRYKMVCISLMVSTMKSCAQVLAFVLLLPVCLGEGDSSCPEDGSVKPDCRQRPIGIPAGVAFYMPHQYSK